MTQTDLATTLAEYRAVAETTGQWDGWDAPEFSTDGERFTPTFVPDAEHAHPAFARVIVYRKDVSRGIEARATWAEAFPKGSEAEDLWLHKPTTLFGAFVERRGIARAFPAQLGKRIEHDEISEDPTATTTKTSPASAASTIDWEERLAAAATVDDVDELRAEPEIGALFAERGEREEEIARAFRKRRREVSPAAIAIANVGTERPEHWQVVTEAEAAAAPSPVPTPRDVAHPKQGPGPMEVALQDALKKRAADRRAKAETS